MDRPEQDNSIKFIGGIFSGTISEEEMPEPAWDQFFDYASLPQGNALQRRDSRQREDALPKGPLEESMEGYRRNQPGRQDAGTQPVKQGVGDSDGTEGWMDAAQGYGMGIGQHGNAVQGYGAEPGQYGSTAQGHGAEPGRYGSTAQGHGAEPGQYGSTAQGYGAEPGRYGSTAQGYGVESGRRWEAGTNHGMESYQPAYWQKEGPKGGPAGNVSCHSGSAYGCGRCRCMYCPNSRKTGHTALVVTSIVAVAALAVAFLSAIFCLARISSNQLARPLAGETDNGGENLYSGEGPFKENNGGWYEGMPLPGAEEDYYGEITDAVRTDLDYSIAWENYEYAGNDDRVTIAVDYPVIEGEVPNLKAINEIIFEETEYFEEYYNEYSKYMMPDELFLVYSEGYVTYMDAEVMSVVFAEMIYTDYWTDYGLYCLNIDVENGVVLDNNSIIEIDEAFAVDFRTRCKQQNGAVSDLDYMSDQEIADYLSSGGTSIIFYTPLGMEVGINMGEYFVTVTYKDYEKFLRKY